MRMPFAAKALRWLQLFELLVVGPSLLVFAFRIDAVVTGRKRAELGARQWNIAGERAHLLS